MSRMEIVSQGPPAAALSVIRILERALPPRPFFRSNVSAGVWNVGCGKEGRRFSGHRFAVSENPTPR